MSFFSPFFPFIKSGRFFRQKLLVGQVSKDASSSSYASIGFFVGYWVQLGPRLPPLPVTSPFLGGEGRGDFRRGREGGESVRLSRPFKKGIVNTIPE